jgi:hypothetical protein
MTVVSSGEQEKKPRPKKLYRGFTAHPLDITAEALVLQPLVQGDSKDNTDTARNEDGVYMSTNPAMVEASYLHGFSDKRLLIEVPQYDSGRGTVPYIQLPSVGIMFEITTTDLDIRPPEMTPELMGVYNNGWEGDEWIADEVPPENHFVIKLVLSRTHNDSEQLKVPIDPNDPKSLEDGVRVIQEEFKKREAEAQEFAEFLETLPSHQRMQERTWRRIWQEKQTKTS